MLARINNQLHFINKKGKMIIVYGSTIERMEEIAAKLTNTPYCIIYIKMEDEFVRIISDIKPDLLIIGGRCNLSDRLLLRHTAERNGDLLISEPGIDYMNDIDEIVKDVMTKLLSMSPVNTEPQLPQALA